MPAYWSRAPVLLTTSPRPDSVRKLPPPTSPPDHLSQAGFSSQTPSSHLSCRFTDHLSFHSSWPLLSGPDSVRKLPRPIPPSTPPDHLSQAQMQFANSLPPLLLPFLLTILSGQIQFASSLLPIPLHLLSPPDAPPLLSPASQCRSLACAPLASAMFVGTFFCQQPCHFGHPGEL